MSEAAARSNPSPRVDELDGLRGLLALWVALAHMLAWSGYWESRLPARFAGAWSALVEASAAVDTFIILSGFAISFLLHKRSQSYISFMTGRFFRIYPVYLLCLVLGIATTFLTPHILQTASWRGSTVYFEWIQTFTNNSFSALGAHTFWHLTLLNGLLPKSYLLNSTATLLPPAWSITLEWQYYLVAPFLARAVMVSGWFRTAVQWALIAAAVAFGYKYGVKWANPMLAFFPAHLPLFLLGIGSYHFYARFHRAENGNRTSAISFVAMIVIGIVFQWHAIALTAWALGFGCIMVRGSNLIGRALSPLRQFLLHPALQWLGHLSFPLYLVHWPIIIAVMSLTLHLFPNISQDGNLAVLLLVGLPLILLTARLIHLHLELPMMALGKKVNPPQQSRSQTVAESVTE